MLELIGERKMKNFIFIAIVVMASILTACGNSAVVERDDENVEVSVEALEMLIAVNLVDIMEAMLEREISILEAHEMIHGLNESMQGRTSSIANVLDMFANSSMEALVLLLEIMDEEEVLLMNEELLWRMLEEGGLLELRRTLRGDESLSVDESDWLLAREIVDILEAMLTREITILEANERIQSLNASSMKGRTSLISIKLDRIATTLMEILLFQAVFLGEEVTLTMSYDILRTALLESGLLEFVTTRRSELLIEETSNSGAFFVAVDFLQAETMLNIMEMVCDILEDMVDREKTILEANEQIVQMNESSQEVNLPQFMKNAFDEFFYSLDLLFELMLSQVDETNEEVVLDTFDGLIRDIVEQHRRPRN